MSGLYQAFRSNGLPTFYGPSKTPWQADLVESGLIFCLVILAVSFFVILPGIGGKQKLFTFIRISVSLFIGGVILISNFAMEWEVSEIHTETKYKVGDGRDITADIGLHIGLRGINITLRGSPENQLNETINYNEHVSWEWRQGRLGFGPFAGRFNREYRDLQLRGLPLPILWIAEYFTFDGEGIRWGRHYRQAGWYGHIVLWLAFPLWVLSNILFFVLLRYGAYFLIMTGCSMITSNIIWVSWRNFNELLIPFTAEAQMTFKYGSSFWICLITGIISVLLGIVIFLMDLRFPQMVATFFNVDVLQDSEFIQVEDETPAKLPLNGLEAEDETEENEVAKRPAGTTNGSREPRPESAEDEEIYEMPASHRRAERTFTQRFQKNRRRSRRPPPPPVPQEEDDEVYENEDVVRSAARRAARPGQVQIEMAKR